MTVVALHEVAPGPFATRATVRPVPRSAVRRPHLVAALAGPDAPPFAVLVAPAGFGKTALLHEWALRDPRPFAWVTLDRRHDDPGVLLRSIARAVDAATSEAPDARIVLVLDNADALRSDAARDTIAAIASEPPAGIAIALASRGEPPLPIARLRVEGLVTELRHGDLAMTRSEAAGLLRAAGVRLSRDDVDVLAHHTEGWPAGLSLAACALGDQGLSGAAVARFSGVDRLVAEYLQDEVLGPLSPGELEFVHGSSILEMLTAPACDAVLERTDSAATLTRLLRGGFPLVALDRTAQRYRHHRLVGEMLRAELRRTDPELEAALHRRASAWYARTGDRDRALQHALEAGEVGSAGDLVWAGVPATVEQVSGATVEHWLNRFTDAEIAAHPRLALTAAGMHLAHGRGHLAAHWIATVDAAGADPEISGGVAALTAALGRDGLAQMRADADRGAALLDAKSPSQALCALLGGVAAYLQGDRDAARVRLEDGARRAAVSAPHVHALCLSQLALLALEGDDWEDAARFSTRARAQVTRYGPGRYAACAHVLAVSALVRAQRGRVDEAHADLQEAVALLAELTDFAPWYEAEVQLVLGRAALRLSDAGDARERLAEARRLASRLPDAVTLRRRLEAAEADLISFTSAASEQPCSLTAAELRILQFLPTHLSFREIAERTYVSANTVKTQANAIYRKLDVRSRSDAVARARGQGLIDA